MLFLTIVFFRFSKMTQPVRPDRPFRVLTRTKKHGPRGKYAKYSEAKLGNLANWLNQNVSIRKMAEITKIPSSTVGEMAKNLREVDGNVDVFVTRFLDHDRKCILSSDEGTFCIHCVASQKRLSISIEYSQSTHPRHECKGHCTWTEPTVNQSN